MSLQEFAKTYKYNPCYHNVGDPVVAFPCTTPEQENKLWLLDDYRVITVSGGTIWLFKKE